MDIRNKYPEFVFESYNVEYDITGIKATFNYVLGEHTFTSEATIAISNITNEEIKKDILDNFFFNFGIINAISYYKLTLAPKFVIKCGKLDANQKEFFKKLFYNGLGELMYRNNILMPYESFMTIEAEEPDEGTEPFYFDDVFHKNLITVGGGKDSVVTLEALKGMRQQNYCMQFNRSIYPENRAAIDCIHLAGYGADQIRDFNVTIDTTLLDLNNQGYYNGHVPFSGMLAFACAITAYLNHCGYIIVSNEASANDGNVAGTTINHQYSKSYEFEKDFNTYLQNYLCDKIQYFSLLRCYNEFEIIQKFIKFPSYLPVFRSCNAGSRTNSWCCNCAKCLYVFIMLYPFVEAGRLSEIFGHNLLDDQRLSQVFFSLISPDTTKPFECVGTREEINYAIKLAIEHPQGPLPQLLEWYRTSYNYNPMAQYDIPNYFNREHNIPEQYLKALLEL